MSNWMIINDDIFSLISHCFVTDSDKIEPRPLTIGSHLRFLQHKIWRHFHLSDLATFGTSSPHKEIPINDKVTPLSSTIFNGASPSNWKMMMLSTQKQSQQQVENFHFSIWPAARNLNHHTDWSVFESSQQFAHMLNFCQNCFSNRLIYALLNFYDSSILEQKGNMRVVNAWTWLKRPIQKSCLQQRKWQLNDFNPYFSCWKYEHNHDNWWPKSREKFKRITHFMT